MREGQVPRGEGQALQVLLPEHVRAQRLLGGRCSGAIVSQEQEAHCLWRENSPRQTQGRAQAAWSAPQLCSSDSACRRTVG